MRMESPHATMTKVLTGIQGFDWVWIGLAVVIDLASYGTTAYGGRRQYDYQRM